MAGKIAIEARKMRLVNFAVFVPDGMPGGKPRAIRQIVEGAKLSLYSFDKHTSKKERTSPDVLVIAENSPENSNGLW